jgi:hypothetical protein
MLRRLLRCRKSIQPQNFNGYCVEDEGKLFRLDKRQIGRNYNISQVPVSNLGGVSFD